MDAPALAPGDSFAAELQQVRALAEPATRRAVFVDVTADAHALAQRFYQALFQDPGAAPLLDHDVVNTRLHASMRSWLVELFDPAAGAEALARTQRTTGEVHARIGVPMVLVGRGARVLKRAILQRLLAGPLERSALLRAAQYVDELLGLAVGAMDAAYVLNTNRQARVDEAYRLFYLGQDMTAERERRRSDLLEWAEQLLQRHYWQADDAAPAAAELSPFSLWLHHKASILFEGAPEVPLIDADVARVERVLVPRLREVRTRHGEARTVVAEIQRATGRIKDLLGALFDRFLAAEDGRDGVTALLNRRYFPAIARREIDVANTSGTGFAVLMIDIDRFGAVAATRGQDEGNLVLAQAAAMLQDRMRAGDFVFRIGDDEFLALVVECDERAALGVAEGLRAAIEGARFRTAAGPLLALTVSIGIAAYDGHPDYQRLLDRADAALRRAKEGGRNRCAAG